jgi:hypothetical protein
MHPSIRDVFGVLTAVVLGAAACNREKAPPPPPETTASPAEAAPSERVVGPLSETDAAALTTMNDRLKDYIDLHLKLEAELPRLPNEATPEQIDKNQRAFEQRMRVARSGAKQGDLFTPEAQVVIKRLLDKVFGGAEGQQLKASIMDENPVSVKLAVNGRYPDAVPISTVPPQVLQTLPKLTEDLEYRFINDNLIILDSHAHVIADYVPDVFPK